MTSTVKARRKYGANSLDLTIPANVCREYELNVGDVFEVLVEVVEGKVRVSYTKVFRY